MLRLRPRRGDDSGAALVEFALVIPLLLMLVFNIVDAGWALSQQNAIRGATREAARVAATQNLDDTGIAAAICADIDKVPTGSITVSAVRLNSGFGSATVTYTPFVPLTDSPWSILQSVPSIGSTLEFRIDGTNLTPAWDGPGPATCP